MFDPRNGRAALAALSTALTMTAIAAAQAPQSEMSIKSAFVLRFPDFVQWPQARHLQRPLTLCLSPSHPFGSNLQASVPRQRSGAAIVVRELRDGESLRTCDVIYVATAELALLDEASDLPILTIGDHPQFCKRGGIINLLVIGGRVRFEIDLARARRSGLKMDSQLLRLASRVYGGQS